MKKLTLLLCFAWIANLAIAQEVSYPNLQLSPVYPQAGKTLEITYKPTKDLEGAKNISCEVFFGKDADMIAHAFDLAKSGEVWKGTFQVPDTVQSMVFALVEGEKRDGNGKDWYTSLVYDHTQKPVSNAFGSLGCMFSNWAYFIKGEEQAAKALELFEKEFAANPANKRKFISLYGGVLKEVKKDEASAIIARELDNLTKIPDLKEKEWQAIYRLYKQLANKTKAEEYGKMIRKKYPTGEFVQNENLNAFYNEENYEKAKKLAEKFRKEFPKSNLISYIDGELASKAAKANKIEEVDAIFKNMVTGKNSDEGSIAGAYNSFAWYLAEKGEYLDKAANYSLKSIELVKSVMQKPVSMSKKPAYYTEKEWKENNQYTYAWFADTYGYIIYQQGKYEEAYSYLKEAVEINKRQNPEINERYAFAFSKIKDNTTLKPELEDFISKGRATAKMKDLLKEIYIKEKGNDKDFDTYLAALEKSLLDKAKEELKKKLIKETAPNFTLQNLKGETFSLADLKGKTVIVDFWATWCGPCIASFPGMQKAVDKYKDDKNVVFLFVDTWEQAKDKKKNASDFITKKGYTFNVLLDTDDKVVKNFGVSGIPTKFIIDGEGNIRFKSVGSNGGDMVAEEIKIMLDLVREMAN